MTRAVLLGLIFWLNAFPCFGADEKAISSEGDAFAAITKALAGAQAGGDTPSAENLATRRVAGKQAAERAARFLRDYPDSDKSEDANAFLNIGLFQSAVAGDTSSATQFRERKQALLVDPKTPDEIKEQIVVMEYQLRWVEKNGKHSLPGGTEERRLWAESLLAAADVLKKKESSLQHVLLLARSPSENFSATERQDFAKRVLEHPGASEFLKKEARTILSGKPPFEIGQPVDLKFVAMDGREVDLAKLKGKVVVIDFWATWCGPCVAEFPKLKRTYEKFHDQGVEFIGISLDSDRKALEHFLKKNGPAPWPQYFDGKGWHNEVSFRFGINGVPTIFVIAKDGKLAATNPGTLVPDETLALEPFLKE